MTRGLFGGRTLRRAGLAGAVATGALLAGAGFDGLVAVDDRLEAVAPGSTRSISTEDGRYRDCPERRREPRLGRDGV